MPPAVARKRFKCLQCSKAFLLRPKEVLRHPNSGSYCSMKCRGLAMRNRQTKKCLQCGELFERAVAELTRNERHFCSRRCWTIWQRAKCKTYPKIGTRHAHRIVMERKLNRRLTSTELVHHKDENKKNYEESNLQLTDRPEHARIHFSKPRKRKT